MKSAGPRCPSLVVETSPSGELASVARCTRAKNHRGRCQRVRLPEIAGLVRREVLDGLQDALGVVVAGPDWNNTERGS